MYFGGPDDIPIEGMEFEKSKPRILVVALFCVAAIVAHFFAQDMGGCVTMAIFGSLLYYFYKSPTHLSITLSLATSFATLFMTGFIWLGILVACELQIWLTDTVTKFEFIVYFLDSVAAGIALYQIQYVFNSPSSGGPRSFLPRWADYGAGGGLSSWSPFQGPAQTVGGDSDVSQDAQSGSKK
ncbi:UNVERIFIED_CONTAM: hypothetical protein HHA_232655 [Hammondia hammondi]|eukprot:XP_008885588.1 hypothetical protein HHA_232655 [Hammondia hammondi]